MFNSWYYANPEELELCAHCLDHDAELADDCGIMISEIDQLLKAFGVPVQKALNPLKKGDFVKLEARVSKKLNKVFKDSNSEIVKEFKDLLKDVDLDAPDSLIDFAKKSGKILDKMPGKIAADVSPAIETSIEDMFRLSKRSQIKRLVSNKKIGKGSLETFTQQDKQLVEIMNKNQSIYIKHGFKKQLVDFDARSKKIFDKALLEGWSNKKLTTALETEFGKIGSKNYWNVVSSAQMNRTRNWANLQTFKDAGFDEYMILAVIDERTSNICKELNGKKFSVKRQLDILEKQALNPDPESLVEKTPWMSTRLDKDGKIEIGIKRKSGHFTRLIDGNSKLVRPLNKIQNLGVAMPPFHGLCRTTVVEV